MRITTKARYAVTAMLELALHENKGPITLADIAEKMGVSLSYLEQLFAALRAKGLVTGTRGPGGGYTLNYDSDKISVADVICAVDDWVEYTQANARNRSENVDQLSSRSIWNDLSNQIFDLTASIMLRDLLEANELSEAAKHNGNARSSLAVASKLAMAPVATPEMKGIDLAL